MKTLTREQRAAATHLYGPVRVIAGAGTGKTTTLANRVANLILKGIPAKDIVALTFTRRAGNELRHRLKIMKIKGHQSVYAGTFHAFTFGLMLRYFRDFGFNIRPVILDEPDAKEVFKLIRGKLANQGTLPKAAKLVRIQNFVVTHGMSVNRAIARVCPEYRDSAKVVKAALREYESYKRRNDRLDFNDILLRFIEGMTTNLTLRKKINGLYRFIHVDEYQDTNPVQAQVVSLLAGPDKNVFVVGDNYQAIYSFTGASVENIEHFHNLFRGTKNFFLTHNFRSSQEILDLSNAIMARAKIPLKKKLISARGKGQKPQIIRPSDSEEEAYAIADQINDLLRAKEVLPKDIAILYRSGWQSTLLELELNRRKIAYKKYGGLRITESAHFKLFLSTLKIISHLSEDISWVRVLTLLDRVGEKAALRIFESFSKQGTIFPLPSKMKVPVSSAKALRRMHNLMLKRLNKSQAFSAAIKFVGPYIKQEYPENWKSRLRDINSLRAALDNHEDIYGFIADLTLEPVHHKDEPNNDQTITLSTIHSAKGLEWRSVTVMGILDGVVPSERSRTPKEIEEERRILYVALTRAKDRLVLSVPSFVSPGWTFFSKESRFLAGLKAGLLEEIQDSNLEDAFDI